MQCNNTWCAREGVSGCAVGTDATHAWPTRPLLHAAGIGRDRTGLDRVRVRIGQGRTLEW